MRSTQPTALFQLIKDKRIRELKQLVKAGWTQEGRDWWRNPRGMHCLFDTKTAIGCAQLAGDIRQARKNWKIV
jgi:hypothetical protein